MTAKRSRHALRRAPPARESGAHDRHVWAQPQCSRLLLVRRPQIPWRGMEDLAGQRRKQAYAVVSPRDAVRGSRLSTRSLRRRRPLEAGSSALNFFNTLLRKGNVGLFFHPFAAAWNGSLSFRRSTALKDPPLIPRIYKDRGRSVYIYEDQARLGRARGRWPTSLVGPFLVRICCGPRHLANPRIAFVVSSFNAHRSAWRSGRSTLDAIQTNGPITAVGEGGPELYTRPDSIVSIVRLPREVPAGGTAVGEKRYDSNCVP